MVAEIIALIGPVGIDLVIARLILSGQRPVGGVVLQSCCEKSGAVGRRWNPCGSRVMGVDGQPIVR
jgi:hypothetical protein